MILVTSSGDVVEVEQPSAQQIRTAYLVTLTGTDGVTWDLNNGPVSLLAGTKLFDMPPITSWTKSTPSIPGVRWTGHHVDEQTYTMPVWVKGDDWEAYRTVDKAFFNGLDPSGEVTVTVTAPDGVSRSIGCRFLSDGEDGDEFDRLLKKYRAYELTLLAPDPYWRGDVVSRSFQVTAPIPWLVPPGPPMYINPPSISDSALIANPGDVPTWWRSTIDGPFTAFTVGVGDALVSSSKSYAAGRVVSIDSSPRQRSIVDEAGNRIYGDMDQVAFAPIPAGAEVPIVLDVQGFGTATTLDVELTPLYWRPM